MSQASKYQRRWFELTSDTLAYAKDAKELKDGGDIEVFAIHELKYVKKLEDDKLEVGQRLRVEMSPSLPFGMLRVIMTAGCTAHS